MPFNMPVPPFIVDKTIGRTPIVPGLTDPRLYDQAIGSISVASVFGLSISGVPASGVVGVAFSFVPNVAGGTAPYSFTLIGTLPSGLSFNSSTGAITGTRSSVSTTVGLSIMVTDSAAATATLGPFSLVFVGSGVNLSAYSFLAGRSGAYISASLSTLKSYVAAS